MLHIQSISQLSSKCSASIFKTISVLKIKMIFVEGNKAGLGVAVAKLITLKSGYHIPLKRQTFHIRAMLFNNWTTSSSIVLSLVASVILKY